MRTIAQSWVRMASPETVLGFDDLEIWVRLGCTRAERADPQAVRVGFEATTPGLPDACRSDALGDTTCYGKLAELFTARAAEREYRTLEHLAFELFAVAAPELAKDAVLMLEVTKLRPPVAGLRGGVRFQLRGSAEQLLGGAGGSAIVGRR